jgi:hypothetical protein
MITINITLGLSWSILSIGFFFFCRYLIRPLVYFRQTTNNKQSITKPFIRTWLTYTNENQWERLNLLISWLHALITSLLVITRDAKVSLQMSEAIAPRE